MARSKVTFDSNAFRRNLNKVANEAAGKVGAKISAVLNGMSSEFEGRPVEEIKPVLQQRWAGVAGGSITDPELSEYAAKIAAGETFDVKVNVR
ncbi:hypothetical protein [Streptomyces sp. rh34]|uniref:hypothetical protein n=1 Tax=Streptomyces sp. rh34 TaxID=2034272 RepID=UPI000BF1276C|nr:hypothetical protein [Streptomyces sp. rh34]